MRKFLPFSQREGNGIAKRRNQLDFAKSTFFSRNQPMKSKFRGAGIISFFKIIQYMFIQECDKFREKILGLGVDLEQSVEFMSGYCQLRMSRNQFL